MTRLGQTPATRKALPPERILHKHIPLQAEGPSQGWMSDDGWRGVTSRATVPGATESTEPPSARGCGFFHERVFPVTLIGCVQSPFLVIDHLPNAGANGRAVARTVQRPVRPVFLP